jgi:hypothetical protein
MKKFVLGLVCVCMVALGAVDAFAGFSSFDPTGPAGTQSDSRVNFTNFAFTGARGGDSVQFTPDPGSANPTGYTVSYVFTSGTTISSSTSMDFSVATTSPWVLKDFSVEGLRSGTFNTYTVTGTATGATGTSVATHTTAANLVTFGSAVNSSNFEVDFVYNGTLGGAITGFNVYFRVEDPSAVPEPTSIAIFGLGAIGFAAKRFRRR